VANVVAQHFSPEGVPFCREIGVVHSASPVPTTLIDLHSHLGVPWRHLKSEVEYAAQERLMGGCACVCSRGWNRIRCQLCNVYREQPMLRL
jgi:hypothetical protein